MTARYAKRGAELFGARAPRVSPAFAQLRPGRQRRGYNYFLTISAFSIIAMPPRSASLPFSVILLPQYSAS